MDTYIDEATRLRVLELYAAGESMVAIESLLSVPLSKVIAIVKGKHSPTSDAPATNPKIRPRHKRAAARALRKARWTFKRIGEHLGITQSAAHRYAKDVPVPYTAPRHHNKAEMLERNQRKAEAIRMRSDGMTLAEIAKRLKRRESTISRWCKGVETPRDRLKEKVRQMRWDGMTQRAIAKALHISDKTVACWVLDIPNPPVIPHNRHPDALRQKVFRMHHEDEMNAVQISKVLGTSHSWVYKVLKEFKSVSDEVYYTYQRDTNGCVIGGARAYVGADGEVVRVERWVV